MLFAGFAIGLVRIRSVIEHHRIIQYGRRWIARIILRIIFTIFRIARDAFFHRIDATLPAIDSFIDDRQHPIRGLVLKLGVHIIFDDGDVIFRMQRAYLLTHFRRDIHRDHAFGKTFQRGGLVGGKIRPCWRGRQKQTQSDEEMKLFSSHNAQAYRKDIKVKLTIRGNWLNYTAYLPKTSLILLANCLRVNGFAKKLKLRSAP